MGVIDLKIEYKSIAMLCLTVFAVFFAIWTFTGKWFWIDEPYNSYILQAQSWKNGRLSLSENYSHLEIAEYCGKYYISFPPFPSYVMFPFVLLGFNNCDGLIALVSALFGAVYAFKIFKHFCSDDRRAMVFSLLLTVGSNWLFTAQVAWVWFIAQNMAFTLSLMAIYYALKKRGISLVLWACAVGCRPFQALYLPLILYLLYNRDLTIVGNLKVYWKSIAITALVALSYMALNFCRFGNPLEFGHNYLPEFKEAPNGQFSVVYIIENLKALIRLPQISFTSAWQYQAFNGTNIFIVSPIFVAYIIYTVCAFVKKSDKRGILVLIFLTVSVQLLCITAHKTMGGSQFGNRYTNDVLPLVFLSICIALPKNTEYDKLNGVLLMFGFAVNAIGSVLYYM